MSKKPKFVAFNVFYGDEDYLLDRAYRKGLAWPDRTVTELDGSTVTENHLISALEQFNIDGSGNVVVLDQAEKVKLGPVFTEYLAEREEDDTSSVLVAIIRKDTIPKAWSALPGRRFSHTKLKPWETDKIKDRLRKEATSLNLKISDEAVGIFLTFYREDLRGMINELHKLTFIVPTGSTVSRDHILLVAPRQLPLTPWDVSEALFGRSPKRALRYLSLLFQSEGDGVSIPIVVSLMRQVERLLIARSMMDQNKSHDAIGLALNIKAYVFKTKVLPIVKRYKVSMLRDQMKNLCELEVKVKGAAQSKRTLVELAVLSLAA